jgi:hypothetical protein
MFIAPENIKHLEFREDPVWLQNRKITFLNVADRPAPASD